MTEEDAVLRNLLITQRYHDLSTAVSEVVGDANVNWATFATWASKTAGQSIRGEEVPPFVRHLAGVVHEDAHPHLGEIGEVVRRADHHHAFLVSPLVTALNDVSASISRGNLKVFAELAPQFVRFVETFGDRSDPEPKLGAYLRGFAPGPVEAGGQDALAIAFSAYARAMRVAEPVEKARLVLLGNCLIGLHEQARLQPEIKQALDAPVRDALHLHAHRAVHEHVEHHRISDALARIARPLRHLEDVLDSVWEEVATRHLMRLALPGGNDLPLGRQITHAHAVHEVVPEHLQEITGPDDLVTVLQRFDRGLRGSLAPAAVNWAVLDDRMHFIVHLFRSRQQTGALLSAPFDAGQTSAIEARVVPAGAL